MALLTKKGGNELMYQNQKSKFNNPQEETHIDMEDVMIGFVEGCKRLNVRKEPRVDAHIVCEIDDQTEVMIDEAESTNDFYKVYTESGIEGFCIKKFIAVQS
jgi:hypothetical protein